jgi:hypothetical protein
VDALRISFLSSFDGQVRLDPGSSGAIAGPATSRSPAQYPGNSGDNLRRTLSVSRDRFKLERRGRLKVGEMLQTTRNQGKLGDIHAHMGCIP